MPSAAHLAAALERHFSNPEHIAFTNFIVVTDGLTAAQAAAIPAPRFNSVWAILSHVWYWQKILLRQLHGEQVRHTDLGAPDGSGWPPAGAPTNEALWQADRQKALTANAELARFVATLTDADLDSEFKAWACAEHEAVNSIFSHNCYLTCEIISVRHMQGFWVEKT